MNRFASLGLTQTTVALVLVGAALVAGAGHLAQARVSDTPGAGLTEVWCQNVDLFDAAYTVVDFYSQGGAPPVSVVDWLHWPWAGHEFVSRGGSRLGLGRYAARASSDYAVACASRTAWSDNGAAIAHTQSEPAAELLVPLVVKRAEPIAGLHSGTSTITVQNASSYASCTASVSFYPDGGAVAVAVAPLELAPGRSRSLRLAGGPDFENVPDGFVGWARISASGPVAASSMVDIEGWAAAYGFEAIPASAVARQLHAAQFVFGALGDPGRLAPGEGPVR